MVYDIMIRVFYVFLVLGLVMVFLVIVVVRFVFVLLKFIVGFFVFCDFYDLMFIDMVVLCEMVVMINVFNGFMVWFDW